MEKENKESKGYISQYLHLLERLALFEKRKKVDKTDEMMKSG